MDADVIRTILRSFGDAENVTESQDYENISKEVVLQSNAVSNTLCESLSNLLCYKVSKQAYQRYSVRLLIIVCSFLTLTYHLVLIFFLNRSVL